MLSLTARSLSTRRNLSAATYLQQIYGLWNKELIIKCFISHYRNKIYNVIFTQVANVTFYSKVLVSNKKNISRASYLRHINGLEYIMKCFVSYYRSKICNNFEEWKSSPFFSSGISNAIQTIRNFPHTPPSIRTWAKVYFQNGNKPPSRLIVSHLRFHRLSWVTK